MPTRKTIGHFHSRKRCSSSTFWRKPSGRAMCQATGVHSGLTSPAALPENLVCHMGTTPRCSLFLQGVLGPALPSQSCAFLRICSMHSHVCLTPRPSSLPSWLCLKGSQEVNFPCPPPPLQWKVGTTPLITHHPVLA